MEHSLVLSSVLLWVVVIANLLLTLALVRRLNHSTPTRQPEGLPVGTPAPDFTAKTLSGESVTLAHYAKRPVVFVFIAPYCGPCREELPNLEALRPVAERAGVALVLVSVEDSDQTQTLVKEFNIRLPILVAPREMNTFERDYKISGTPGYCFVDAQGTVQSSGHPWREYGPWQELIESWESPRKPFSRLALSGRR